MQRMHVHADSVDDEIRATVDAAVELSNLVLDLADGESGDDDRAELPTDPRVPVRELLVGHGFVRAAGATDADLQALLDRSVAIARLVDSLPEAELRSAVEQVNAALEVCAIAPSLSAHDGSPLHIHWTAAATPFAHQVAVDLLMALAQTLCDHGTERFGRCAAEHCGHVFYDTTKNRSRRFCSDPRCASRTHTAAHRARHARDT